MELSQGENPHRQNIQTVENINKYNYDCYYDDWIECIFPMKFSHKIFLPLNATLVHKITVEPFCTQVNGLVLFIAYLTAFCYY